MAQQKVIYLAGGLSSRLYPLTDGMPKCMLEVNGKSIIQRQREVFTNLGLNKLIIVTGYHGEIIEKNHSDLVYIYNGEYKNTNILFGLFCAEKEMVDGFLFSYSDILCSEEVVKKLLVTPGDIVLTVSTNWQDQYQNREKHPVTEAELVKVEDGLITKIGKDVVSIDEAHGEFIGLAKFSAKGAEISKEVFHDLLKKYKKEEPFQNAKEFQRAYLTDFIQELIDRGIEVRSSDITNVWTEIDTDEDLERARRIWK